MSTFYLVLRVILVFLRSEHSTKVVTNNLCQATIWYFPSQQNLTGILGIPFAVATQVLQWMAIQYSMAILGDGKKRTLKYQNG